MQTLFNLAAEFLDDIFYSVSFSHYEPYAVHSLGSTYEEVLRNLKEFREYTMGAASHLISYGTADDYFKDDYLSLLFLPWDVDVKKSIHFGLESEIALQIISESNLFDARSLGNIWLLCFAFVDSTFVTENFERVTRLLSKLPSLKAVQFDAIVSDEILESLALNCPEVRLLDLRHPSHCLVTDSGLQQLTRLRKLRYVLFDDSEASFRSSELHQVKYIFTPNGIAELMKSLPELIRFDCLPSFIEGSLRILTEMNTPLPTVKIFQLHESAETYFLAPQVCPNIEICKVEVHPSEVNQAIDALSMLTKLDQLSILFRGDIDLTSLNHTEFGIHFTTLTITKACLTSQELQSISDVCINLSTLAIYSTDYVDSSDDSRLIFPSLKTLIYGLAKPEGILLFMFEDLPLISLYVDRRYRPPNAFFAALKVDRVYWPHLRHFNDWRGCCALALLTRVAETMPSLETICITICRDGDPSFESPDTLVMSTGRIVNVLEFSDEEVLPTKIFENKFDLS